VYRLSSFNAPTTTVPYTLSLHDALPICSGDRFGAGTGFDQFACWLRSGRLFDRAVEVESLLVADVEHFHGDQVLAVECAAQQLLDRKSTRLNSSHQIISYAVFCLKQKKT